MYTVSLQYNFNSSSVPPLIFLGSIFYMHVHVYCMYLANTGHCGGKPDGVHIYWDVLRT